VSTCLNFSPFGITTFTASALLQGIRGKLLQLHALRLAAAAKSAIADFRKYISKTMPLERTARDSP